MQPQSSWIHIGRSGKKFGLFPCNNNGIKINNLLQNKHSWKCNHGLVYPFINVLFLHQRSHASHATTPIDQTQLITWIEVMIVAVNLILYSVVLSVCPSPNTSLYGSMFVCYERAIARFSLTSMGLAGWQARAPLIDGPINLNLSARSNQQAAKSKQIKPQTGLLACDWCAFDVLPQASVLVFISLSLFAFSTLWFLNHDVEKCLLVLVCVVESFSVCICQLHTHKSNIILFKAKHTHKNTNNTHFSMPRALINPSRSPVALILWQ